MRAKEFILIESEGGMARRAEEAGRGKRVAFKNADGNVINMIASQVFPQDTDKRDNYQELVPEIMDYVQANNVAVSNTLTLPAVGGLSVPEKAGAALVMIFKDETSKKNIAWIALKPAKKPGAYPIFLQTKQFSDLTGYVQLSGKAGEEDKISGVQQRALTNLKPVGIIPTNTEIAVDDISVQVQGTIQGREDLSNEIKQQVVQLLDAVSSGSTNPIPGAGDFAKSYEIDLGETAAPVSLVKKKFLSGAWQQAEAGMGLKFENARGIEYPNDPAEKLYDSYLKFDGGEKDITIRISSKDKAGGAKASVSGVVDDISTYPDRYEGLFDPATNPGFDKMLEIVEIIKDPDMKYVAASSQWKRNGSIAGALQLGVTVGVITGEQAAEILTIIDSDQPHVSDEELGDLKGLLVHKGTDDNTRPDYRIGWHLLAAVATAVADQVNKNYKTDAFFKAVLERSNMLQIKTSLVQKPVKDTEGKQTNGAYFSNFEVIYPPVFTGTIRLDASSNFYATRRPVGKMGFAIK
jgi:hypothetical protein